jgi:hypothetical protein
MLLLNAILPHMNHYSLRTWICLFLLSTAVVAGCNSAPVEKPRVAVSGNVTLDGQPLPDGEIGFVSTAEGVNDTLPIQQGKFSGQVSVGERKVEIRAYREVKAVGAGGYVPPGAETSKENFIPAKYNTDSKLTANVEPGKEGTPLEFAVKSK